MLTVSLILLFVSKAPSIRRDLPVPFRIVVIEGILFIIFIALYNSYINPLEKGIDIYSGLFHVASFTLSFNTFLFTISFLILTLNSLLLLPTVLRPHLNRLWTKSIKYLNENKSNIIIIALIIIVSLFMKSTVNLFIYSFTEISVEGYWIAAGLILFRGYLNSSIMSFIHFYKGKKIDKAFFKKLYICLLLPCILYLFISLVTDNTTIRFVIVDIIETCMLLLSLTSFTGMSEWLHQLWVFMDGPTGLGGSSNSGPPGPPGGPNKGPGGGGNDPDPNNGFPNAHDTDKGKGKKRASPDSEEEASGSRKRARSNYPDEEENLTLPPLQMALNRSGAGSNYPDEEENFTLPPLQMPLNRSAGEGSSTGNTAREVFNTDSIPEDTSSEILRKLKDMSRDTLGKRPKLPVMRPSALNHESEFDPRFPPQNPSPPNTSWYLSQQVDLPENYSSLRQYIKGYSGIGTHSLPNAVVVLNTRHAIEHIYIRPGTNEQECAYYLRETLSILLGNNKRVVLKTSSLNPIVIAILRRSGIAGLGYGTSGYISITLSTIARIHPDLFKD